MAETPIGPGTRLAGRFVLEDLLNESDGARFYRAHDNVLARDVAVHVVSADDPRSAALMTAARTSATVADAHLLRVLDAATEDGISYVVNEWGSGISLDKLLLEGPLSPRRAAWVVKEVAEAVVSAHSQGIAHGRLLPENVVISDSGSVKLVGFVVDAVLRGRDHRCVVDGRALGEHDADVLNLGALLYAGLVARWPGTAGSRLPTAPAEHGRALRPRQVRAGVPRSLDAVCERVLSRSAHDVVRIDTAHEIYAALSDFIGDPAAVAPAGPVTGSWDSSTVLDTDPDATQAGAPAFDDLDLGSALAPGAVAAVEDPEATQLSRSPSAPPPPPPPFPEPEERPLFADAPRRTPVEPDHDDGYQTHHSGHLRPPASPPPAWGPDAAPDTGELDPADWPAEPGRSAMRAALAIGGALVVVVAVILAFNLGRGATGGNGQAGEPESSGEASAPSGPVAIVAISDFDPEADPPSENPEAAPLAIDGDKQTAWGTSTYFDPIDLLKDGVGLRVDLGEPTRVAEVNLTFLGSPTSVELLAADDGADAPTSIDGLTRVASKQDAGTTAVLKLDEPTTTRYLVVWLTSLPKVADGFKGQVAEIAVKS